MRREIIVVSFPLPSPTNYMLLASLLVVLSHVYDRIHVVAGGLPRSLSALRELVYGKRGRGAIMIYDAGIYMERRGRGAAKYLVIQARIAAMTLRALARAPGAPVLFFIGIPHMVHLLLLARIAGRKTVYY